MAPVRISNTFGDIRLTRENSRQLSINKWLLPADTEILRLSLQAFSHRNKGWPPQVVCRSLVALIFVGFFLRIVAWEIFGDGLNSGYRDDEIGYVALATHLTEGLGFTDHLGNPTSGRVPGLPLLVAIPVS